MMNDGAIKKVIRLRFRRLRKHYGGIISGFDEEAIHDFRVEYKKLRAFIRLLSIGSDRQITIPKSLKSIYQKAGAVRDLQLHKKYIDGENRKSEIPRYRLQLRKKLTAAKRELKKVLEPEVLQKVQKKMEKKIPADLSATTVDRFATLKTATIDEMLSKKLIRDDDLHTVRKSVKDIIYDARIFKTELSVAFPWKAWNEKREEYFTSLAEELGSFQDACTVLMHLKEFSNQEIPAKERQLTGDIIRQQLRIKRQSKKELVKSLRIIGKQTTSNGQWEIDIAIGK